MFVKKTFTAISALVIIGLCVPPGFAGGAGTTGAQFLKIGVGARPVSMGGAFSAVADDLNAIYWNPAGLAGQSKKQLSGSYVQYFQEASIGFLGFSMPIREGRTLGMGLNYLSIGGFEKRLLDTDIPDSKFGANDAALYLSYGDEKLLDSAVQGLSIGCNVKFIRQQLDDETAQSYALDLASLYKTPVAGLNVGLGLYNLGTAVKFVEESDPLPLDIRLGVAYRMLNRTLTLAADLDDYVNDERVYTQLGAEYRLVKVLSMRAGYKIGMDSNELGGLTGLGTGIGVNIWNIQFDYAYAPFGELGDTHRVSLATTF